jgi:hypothetical protein
MCNGYVSILSQKCRVGVKGFKVSGEKSVKMVYFQAYSAAPYLFPGSEVASRQVLTLLS